MTPTISRVLDAVVAKLESLETASQPRVRFKRHSERLEDAELPGIGCLRKFNLDVVAGSDDSAQGQGVIGVGIADLRAQLTLRVAYPKGRQEAELERTMGEDAEIAMRSLGREADWKAAAGIYRSLCAWRVDRSRAQDKFFLELTLVVQYRA